MFQICIVFSADLEYTSNYGSCGVLLVMFGYFWSDLWVDFGLAGSNPSDRARPELRKSDSDRNWSVTCVDGYPNIPESTLYDPEFDVDSKSVFKVTVTTRNHDLQPPIETTGQASQLDIPARPNRTDIWTRHQILTQKNPNLYPGHYPTARTSPNG